MQKSKIFAIGLGIVLAFFLVSSVSAYSIWEPKYESYKLGASKYGNGAYSSTSTYEKTVVENEDRYGSNKETTIKKTETETYTPSKTRYWRNDGDYHNDREYRDDDNIRYIYTDSYGRTSFYDKYRRDIAYERGYDTYIRYDDGSWYPSSNWRFKETYNPRYYPNENTYGYDYYYGPRYDWHQEVYNWRY